MSLVERHSSYKPDTVPYVNYIGTKMLLARAKAIVNALLPTENTDVFACLPTHVTANIVSYCLAQFCSGASSHYRESLCFAVQELVEVARQERTIVSLEHLQVAHRNMLKKAEWERKKLLTLVENCETHHCGAAKRRKHN